MNKIILMARLVNDPELKNVSGTDLCKLRVANNRIVGKSKVEKSIFIDVNVWANQAVICNKYLKKGSRVLIEGVLCQSSYKSNSGENMSKIYIDSNNVAFLDSAGNKNAEKDRSEEENSNADADADAETNNKGESDQTYDDDLPF